MSLLKKKLRNVPTATLLQFAAALQSKKLSEASKEHLIRILWEVRTRGEFR